MRVVAVEPCMSVLRWCACTGAEHAIVGGFYVRPEGPPLGELWIDGAVLDTQPFDAPWQERRACVHVADGEVRLLARGAVGDAPAGDLLQAGPMLRAAGHPLVLEHADPEGFSAGAHQFDSDITVGRYPRAALGLSESELIAVVCDGRAEGEAGLTLEELATAMAQLGASDAINLDGGGSASLVVEGALVNRPREQHGIELVGGRAVATLLHFEPPPAPAR